MLVDGTTKDTIRPKKTDLVVVVGQDIVADVGVDRIGVAGFNSTVVNAEIYVAGGTLWGDLPASASGLQRSLGDQSQEVRCKENVQPGGRVLRLQRGIS